VVPEHFCTFNSSSQSVEEELELNDLIYVGNSLGKNINTIKKKREASKEIGLEVSTERTSYTFVHSFLIIRMQDRIII
jgi:hypothetical protein